MNRSRNKYWAISHYQNLPSYSYRRRKTSSITSTKSTQLKAVIWTCTYWWNRSNEEMIHWTTWRYIVTWTLLNNIYSLILTCHSGHGLTTYIKLERLHSRCIHGVWAGYEYTIQTNAWTQFKPTHEHNSNQYLNTIQTNTWTQFKPIPEHNSNQYLNTIQTNTWTQFNPITGIHTNPRKLLASWKHNNYRWQASLTHNRIGLKSYELPGWCHSSR
jgi:hypothetical protein